MHPAKEWVEVEPLVFRRVDREDYAVFREDADGRPTDLFLGINAFERLAWYQSGRVQVPLLQLSLLVFLSAFVGWPAAALGRRLRRRPTTAMPAARRARWIATLVSFASVALVISGVIVTQLMLQARVQSNLYGLTRVALIQLGVANLIAVLTVTLPVFAVQAWRRGWWSRLGRMHYTLVTAAALYFVLFLGYWNQLGFCY